MLDFGGTLDASVLGMLSQSRPSPLLERSRFSGRYKLWLDTKVSLAVRAWLKSLHTHVFIDRCVCTWMRRGNDNWAVPPNNGPQQDLSCTFVLLLFLEQMRV